MKTVLDLIQFIEDETGETEIVADARSVVEAGVLDHDSWYEFFRRWKQYSRDGEDQCMAFDTLQYILWHMLCYPDENWSLLDPENRVLETLNEYVARRDA